MLTPEKTYEARGTNERLCAGSVEIIRTFLRCLDMIVARALLQVVFPTPPLPQNISQTGREIR